MLILLNKLTILGFKRFGPISGLKATSPTSPTRPEQPHAILEYGSILVCPKKLTELDSYQTLVRPLDLSLITASSIRATGITANDVISCPTFSVIADKVYDILHGRVWAGHNIVEFDCERLKEAYAQIDRPPPVPKGIIDTLDLLTRTFVKRPGDIKMANLAAYFRLGQQRNRSLDDVRMIIEVVKLCASVLFLESSLQDTENNWASLNSNRKSTLEVTCPNISPFTSTESHTVPPNVPNLVESGNACPDPFLIGTSVDRMKTKTLLSNEAMVEESSFSTLSNAFRNDIEFIDPDLVSMPSVTVTVAPFVNGPQSLQILHRHIPMQIHCNGMRIHIGLRTQLVDHAENPRLGFVVDASSSSLCIILDACDNIAKRFVDYDGTSKWRPVLTSKTGFNNSPTIRLHILTVADDTTRWITKIYYKNSSSIPCTQQLVSSVTELGSLLHEGSFVDAYFSLDPYNYQQNAGIRLLAKKLIIYTS